MTLFLVALLASAAPAAADRCASLNGANAPLCRATGFAAANKYAEAAAEFEAAARLLPPGDARTAHALAAAGNMWIAAGQSGKAALALDRALAGTGLRAEQRGEALLDRARAAEAQNDLKTARAKVTEAAATIANDPFYWYFSAALAIREGDKATAESAIGKALSLAPADPTILFEAGHVAHFLGNEAAARDYWTRAAAADPKGPSGEAARRALALLPAPVTFKIPPAKGN